MDERRRAADSVDPSRPDPSLTAEAFEPCGRCGGLGGNLVCPECGGLGSVPRGEEERPEWLTEDVAAVLEVFEFVERDGLAAWMEIHGPIGAEGLELLMCLRREVGRLEFEGRVEDARKARKACPRKP